MFVLSNHKQNHKLPPPFQKLNNNVVKNHHTIDQINPLHPFAIIKPNGIQIKRVRAN